MALYKYNGDEMTDIVYQTDRDYFCCFSLFETIGVCGDSYACGVSAEQPDEDLDGTHSHFNACWPAVLARRNGVTVTNYSYGGLSTRSWRYSSSYGLPRLLSESPKQLYILALERNDYNIIDRAAAGSSDENYLGALTDITENSLGSYPDTFYGNYATIIESIQNYSPRSRIVMMAGDYSSRSVLGTALHNAMAEIAAYYEIPIIRQRDDSYVNNSYVSDKYYRYDPNGGHPQPIAYTGLYLSIERLFNKCVRDYKSYFQYYTGNLTPVTQS